MYIDCWASGRGSNPAKFVQLGLCGPTREISVALYAPTDLKIASSWPQVASSWHQVGSRWPGGGFKMAQVDLKIAPSCLGTLSFGNPSLWLGDHRKNSGKQCFKAQRHAKMQFGISQALQKHSFGKLRHHKN